MRGMLVSEVSFGRRMGVLDALLLPFLQMNVRPQLYVVVEAVEGRCKSSGICGRRWRWVEDAESLPEIRGDTTNSGWRNIADRLSVRPLIDLPVKWPPGLKVDCLLEG